MKILFMCVANSARSQIAEGLAKKILGRSVEVQSAGSKPSTINPFAIQVLKENNLEISDQFSKAIEDLKPDFIHNLDYVITLCAEEVCPVILSTAQKLHWPMPDPAGHDQLTHEEKLNLFRRTRDLITEKLIHFKKEINL